MKIFGLLRLLSFKTQPRLRYCMSTYSNSAAYGGDGKTTVRILNDDEPHINLVNTYSHKGFRLASNLFVGGSILLFPTHVFSWSVKRGIEITMDSLIVFDLIVPKTKIVIIGYGQQGEPYDSSIPIELKNRGISCELLPTPNAVTTYNFLAADGLHVAGAFIPVKDPVTQTTRDTQAIIGHDSMFRGYDRRVSTDGEREGMDYLYERAMEVTGKEGLFPPKESTKKQMVTKKKKPE